MADFFSLPQGADPENDPLTGGQDEFGNPLRQTFLGTVYSLQQQPAEKKFESEPGTMARAKEFGSGIVEGAIEGVKQAVTAPRRAMQGEDITYGDVLGTAGMATTGASVATKPKGSLSAGAARTKKKSEINPLFKRREAKDSSLVTFYSPLRSAIEEMQFSEKGKSGQEIMAYLNKRAPNVSKGEIDFSRIDLDPKKKYSKDEVLDNLQYSTEGVKAKLIERDFANYERSQIPKNYLDAYDDYFEITLEPQALPKQLRTHHTNKTLGHSRATVHTSRKGDGERYIVLNEIQSDALQNAGKKDTSNLTTPRELADQFAESVEDDTGFAMSGEARGVLDFISKYYEDPKLAYEDVKKAYKDDFGLDVQGRDVPTLHKDALRKSLGSDAENVRSLDLVMEEMPVISQRLQEAKTSYEKTDIPIKSNTEYVKNILVANIAKARKMGIDTLVVPSIDEIARLRASDFDGGISAAKKALKPTYVDAVKKAVSVLNNEYGDRIKLGTKDIDYEDLTKPDKTRTTKGLALDISKFDFDPRNEAVRFAEGGEVKSMEEQMNLFEYGGLADDGMTKEPVTGNEVPPGSMAKEVRDDVPAMLSEGEYVVPADVVRYFGVKFFEDLRDTAKSDMVDMEQQGRIGGQPVDNNGVPEEELSEEEMVMLREALASDQTVGMAEGGLTSPTFRYSPGQPYPMGGGYNMGSGFEARQYVNSQTGQIRTFQFLNGKPVSLIPAGFVPYVAPSEGTTTPTTPTPTTPTTTTPQTDFGGGADGGQEGFQGRDPNAPPSYGIGQTASAIGLGAAGAALTGNILGAAGGAKSGNVVGQFNEARNALSNAVLSGDKQAQKAAEDAIQSLHGKLGTVGHMVTFNEGKTPQEAIENVINAAKDYQARTQTPTAPVATPAPPVPQVTTTTLAPAPVATTTAANVPTATPTAPLSPENYLSPTPIGAPGTTATPAITYSSGNVAPTSPAPAEPTFTGFETQNLGIPSFGTEVPSLDEAIFGVDTPQTGGLFGGKDVSQDVVNQVAQQAAISRQAALESQVPVSAFGPVNKADDVLTAQEQTLADAFRSDAAVQAQAQQEARMGLDVFGGTGEVSAPTAPAAPTAATAPGASIDIGGRDVSVGYGVGQVDPGLAAAASAADRGGSDGGFSPSVSAPTASTSPGASTSIGGRDVSVGYGVGQVDPGLAAAAQSAAAPSVSVGYGVGQVDPGLAAAAASASRGGGGDGSGMSPAEAASTPSAQAAARGGIEAGIAARGGSDTGGGDGGGGKVICTALHNKGLLDSRIYELDEAYGQIVRATNPDLMVGYHKLAKPFAAYIQKDTPLAITARYAVAPFARAWAQEMAHTMRPDEFKGSLLGKAIMAITYPVCEWVGKKEQETVYGRV
jgi:hypothetical protein